MQVHTILWQQQALIIIKRFFPFIKYLVKLKIITILTNSCDVLAETEFKKFSSSSNEARLNLALDETLYVEN